MVVISGVTTTEVILKANDVIFSKVRSCLNLYEYDVLCSSVFATVGLSNCDVNTLAGFKFVGHSVKYRYGVTTHNEPVLGALGVALVAETLVGQDDDLLHLVTGRLVVEHGEVSPWTLLELTTLAIKRAHSIFSLAEGWLEVAALHDLWTLITLIYIFVDPIDGLSVDIDVAT